MEEAERRAATVLTVGPRRQMMAMMRPRVRSVKDALVRTVTRQRKPGRHRMAAAAAVGWLSTQAIQQARMR
jgi:hypothetical protein